MRAKLLTAGASALSIISVMLLAATAEAQAVRRVVGLKTHSPTSRDINGVNLATGQFTPPPVVATIGNGTSSFSESIGGTDFPNGSNFVGGITFVDPNDFVTQKQSAKTVIKNDNVVLVYFGNYRKMFTLENGEYVAHDGSMDRLEGGGASLGNFFLGSATLTTSDGTKVYFTGLTPWVSVGTVPLLPSDYGVDAKFAILSRIEKPDGETYDLVFTQEGIDTGYGQFDQQGSTSPPDQLVKTRLDEIRGNLGYSMWGQSLDGLAAYTITNYAAPAPLLRSVYVSAVHSPTSYQALPTESVVVRAQSNWDGMIIETQSKEIFGNGVLAWGSTDRYAYEERVQDRVHTVCSEPASQWVNDYPETNMAADIATPFSVQVVYSPLISATLSNLK